ncbi:UDP-3-O-acyl-N-acetylglucosamine deacetylase [Limoniibacter endophyticus]|uniref:UDP-3-O-acyl-N-acetylglucosamine deacetylase n=1 Tax=Limoniibacter endophyticus TaxID=1565040 RepID=A0A8J3DK02_9HYPH|nr:UDP-3-O-acyl-N-acetylglucosamine deacetylase [Limoniibacter endophyticus]GHC75239.1 UDP-3-O-acyl-N-acetylglucosamine deacetylase [Limoniibacter endophyticus]
MPKQTTLAASASISGIGVHSGRPASLHFHPGAANTGIVFRTPEGVALQAVSKNVGATSLATVLGDMSGVFVATIEHLMAAISGMGIDNLTIDIDGREVPILDGSALCFVELFDETGLAQLDAPRRALRVLKDVRVEKNDSFGEFMPYDGRRFEIEIDFASPAIGRQSFAADLTPEIFRVEIASARTFGFAADVEKLREGGFALGSSLENSVGIGADNDILNPEGLRFPDEFVRHKTLDAIGDLALSGLPIIGCFRSYKGGHALNAAALGALIADSSAFELVDNANIPKGSAEVSVDLGPSS